MLGLESWARDNGMETTKNKNSYKSFMCCAGYFCSFDSLAFVSHSIFLHFQFVQWDCIVVFRFIFWRNWIPNQSCVFEHGKFPLWMFESERTTRFVHASKSTQKTPSTSHSLPHRRAHKHTLTSKDKTNRHFLSLSLPSIQTNSISFLTLFTLLWCAQIGFSKSIFKVFGFYFRGREWNGIFNHLAKAKNVHANCNDLYFCLVINCMFCCLCFSFSLFGFVRAISSSSP